MSSISSLSSSRDGRIAESQPATMQNSSGRRLNVLMGHVLPPENPHEVSLTSREVSAREPIKGFKEQGAEFTEFTRRLLTQDKQGVEAAWREIPNINQLALEVAECLKRPAKEQILGGTPRAFDHPKFEAITLYALSTNVPEDKRIGVMECSQGFCYHEAVRLFGKENVTIHYFDEKGEIWEEHSKVNPSSGRQNCTVIQKDVFSESKMGLKDYDRSDILAIPDHLRIFYTVKAGAYTRHLDSITIEEALNHIRHYAGQYIAYSQPLLERSENGIPNYWDLSFSVPIYPPKFLEGLMKTISPFHDSRPHPVLGLSAPEDFDDFSKRDMMVPSSFASPGEADGLPCPHSIAMYRHDAYHVAADATNPNLPAHQKIFNFVNNHPDKNLLDVHLMKRSLRDFFRDRDYSGGSIFKDTIEALKHNGKSSLENIALYKEMILFLDVALFMRGLVSLSWSLVSDEDQQKVDYLLNNIMKFVIKEFPDFSMGRAYQFYLENKHVFAERISEDRILDDDHVFAVQAIAFELQKYLSNLSEKPKSKL